MKVDPLVVETAHGPGHLYLHPAGADKPRANLLISHGAGNGSDTQDLLTLAELLPQQGINVARFDQPWRVAGRKVATAPPTLDVGLRAAAAELAEVWAGRLIVGGRSAGARSACRCANSLDAAAVLAISFPLHPPGRPEKSRLAELEGVAVPTLVVQGERDSMGRPEEFPRRLWTSRQPPARGLYVIDRADHGLKVPKSAPVGADEAYLAMAEEVRRWIDAL